MKKAILLAILCAVLMTGCDDYDEDSEIISRSETTESVTASGEVSCETTEICSDTIPLEVSELFCTEEIMEFSEIQEIIMTNEEIQEDDEDEQEPEIIEISEETAPEPTETAQPETTVAVTEEMTETSAESVIQTDFMTETETIPETVEITEIVETEPEIFDAEKAQMVYEYMLENGCGTCVNYACQAYEKCLEIGLPCYIVWTGDMLSNYSYQELFE